MKLLRDKELVDLVKDGKITRYSEFTNDWYGKESPVQPTSLDFHVGKIYLPGVSRELLGGCRNPKNNSHTLMSGETVLIETREELCVPDDIAGVGFPPASNAVKGLLMLNPGHIDPGYRGRLSFTVINMGKDPYTVRAGDSIFSAVWFKLDAVVGKSYGERTGGTARSIEEANLSVLSSDFLNVEHRAEEIAKKYRNTTAIIAGLVTTIIMAFGGVAQYYITSQSGIREAQAVQAAELSFLREKFENRSSAEITDVREGLKTVIARLDHLEARSSHPTEQ